MLELCGLEKWNMHSNWVFLPSLSFLARRLQPPSSPSNPLTDTKNCPLNSGGGGRRSLFERKNPNALPMLETRERWFQKSKFASNVVVILSLSCLALKIWTQIPPATPMYSEWQLENHPYSSYCHPASHPGYEKALTWRGNGACSIGRLITPAPPMWNALGAIVAAPLQ